MDIDPTQVIELLAVAMATAIVMRRLALPYTVGLVVVGAGLAFARIELGAPLTRDFIFDVILPPLLFEAALNLRWSALRKDLGLILVLSTAGTVIAGGVVAWAMVALMGWPLPAALVFGALIAATDPVAVIAMFKDNDVRGRLRTLVESESLFNDAAAAVLFSVALSFATLSGEAAPMALDLGWRLAYVVIGGAVIGAASGGLALMAAGRASDHLIEAALTTLAAYGAFFGAERLGVSGILATVIAGLLMGNMGVLHETERISERGREVILSLWDFAAFLANSAVFLLIGVSIGKFSLGPEAAAPIGAAILIVLIARALTIYPLCAAFRRTGQATNLKEQLVLWWGGLRGALALALALSLPATLAYRDEIVITTFAVAAFSIVVQGLTMPFLLRRLGFIASLASRR